jgi:tetratricopeptide (TPR) repeat protein
MILQWFEASEATKIGVELADQFARRQATHAATHGNQSARTKADEELHVILLRADREVRGLRLNFYKKAKIANSFKWRLLENGVEKTLADAATQRLVLHLSGNHVAPALSDNADARANDQPLPDDAKYLLVQGNRSIARGAYSEAIGFYQDLIKIAPHHVAALNNLGAALAKLGRAEEAESYFYQAIKIEPKFPDAHSNIGNALLLKGQYAAAERFLQRALKLNPRLVDARVNLGLVFAFLGRLRDARSQFDKALKLQPGSADALSGLALIAMAKGSFEQTGAMLSRALQASPRMPRALALQAGLRRMTRSDGAWLKNAEEVAAGEIAALDESELRFAIAKYYDDVEDFKRAFQNYKRANDLLKSIAKPYDRKMYKSFVDIMIRNYTQDVIAGINGGASNSMKPVFVIGMPRSGTSLAEQIISSHPSAKGAGELEFWTDAAHEYEAQIHEGPLDESRRKKLSEAYLRVLGTKAGDALRIVDKAPVNADYLGVIHSVFPNARIIYMQRDPIDTCLSCYFQKFVLSLNFAMDLSDLADHYRQHWRLMTHWHAVLPPGTILTVPYEELVADQEGWTRKILDFLGLEWDGRVLNFHETKREVVTASFWQVRQKIYKSSVQRWRNYEEFIGPLGDLKGLASVPPRR